VQELHPLDSMLTDHWKEQTLFKQPKKSMKTLILKKTEERRIRAGHSWIYSNEVNTSATPLKNYSTGSQVVIHSSNGKLLGSAYVNPHSLICARIFSTEAQQLDSNLLQERITSALRLRERLFPYPYYRLVYGERDLLPGLVVDRYGAHLVAQINTAGMEAVRSQIIEALVKTVAPQSILLKNDSSIRTLEGLPLEVHAPYGEPPDDIEIIENNVHMVAPLYKGQKTGWFYDHRLNRAKLKPYVAGKRVLDIFSYVGSFSIQAATFGAREIWAVDASRTALEYAEENARLNKVADTFTGAHGDCFDVLDGLREENEMFDVIVIDPPAFIKRKKDHQQGLKAYRRINSFALDMLNPGGILLSASCSMHLKREELVDVLRSSSLKKKRHLQIVEEGHQGPDHPIHPAMPETRYIKAFLAAVS